MCYLIEGFNRHLITGMYNLLREQLQRQEDLARAKPKSTLFLTIRKCSIA